MTNEEKAISYELSNDLEENFHGELEEAFLSGCEWKEQQMIEKAVEFLNDWFTDDICNCRIPITKNAREKFFNDFRKYMEEN